MLERRPQISEAYLPARPRAARLVAFFCLPACTATSPAFRWGVFALASFHGAVSEFVC